MSESCVRDAVVNSVCGKHLSACVCKVPHPRVGFADETSVPVRGEQQTESTGRGLLKLGSRPLFRCTSGVRCAVIGASLVRYAKFRRPLCQCASCRERRSDVVFFRVGWF